MASGWNPNDFVLNPDGFENAKDILFSSIEQVRALWRGEAVSFPGPKGDVDVKTLPRPVQDELPIWVTAAGNPETFRRAGEIGANILTHLLGQNVDKVAENVEIYRQARTQAGHSGDGIVTVMAHTLVAKTEAQAKDISREPMKDYLRSALALIKDAAWQFPTFKRFSAEGERTLQDFFNEGNPQDVDDLLEFAFERYFNNNSLLGSVEKCVAMCDALKQAGANEIGCLIDFGIDDKTVLDHLSYLEDVRAGANAKDRPSQSVSETIRDNAITHVQCTPSRATMMLLEPDAKSALSNLKCLMVGGEPMSAELADQLTSATSASIFNMYGPTETTIWSTVGDIEDADDAKLIGRPLANQTVHIVDARGVIVPPGTIGELAIGGLGVTSGYLGQPELTADRFTEIRNAEGNPVSVYKTGDLARLRQDGLLEFGGRADSQVKVRGYRIELGEIEACLQRHRDINAAAAVVQRPNTPNAIIVGFVVVTGDDVSLDDLRNCLFDQLPEFMVPSHLVALPQLPSLPNGKLDRKHLEAYQVVREARTDAVMPSSQTERDLAAIWSDLLNVETVSVTDNFFELGGHSLLAIQAIDAIEKKLNVRLNPRKILTNSLEQLAQDCSTSKQPEKKQRVSMFSRLLGRK